MTAAYLDDPMGNGERLKEAIRSLHCQKDAAYGNSWKKRGEQISVMANIARKVDRLEVIANSANPSQDESILDTTVDLYVYGLKYITYLADQDPAIATEIFGEQPMMTWSDGPAGFERLLAKSDISAIDRPPTRTISAAIQATLETFAALEQCFTGHNASAPPERRASLAADAAQLLAAIRGEDHTAYETFLATWHSSPSGSP